MAKNTLIAAGPKLQQKLKELANDVTNVDLTPAQKVSNRQEIISRRGTGSGKTSAYNGYFTIKDVSTRNEDGTIKEYRVAVCDGESWDAVTETSRSSRLQFGEAGSFSFESKVFSISKRATFYIKYGPTDKYINQIVARVDEDDSFVLITGYVYLYLGSVSVKADGTMDVYQANTQFIVPHPTLQKHYGDFSFIGLETPEGVPIKGKLAVCNGSSWDARKQTSGESLFYVNGILERFDCTIIEGDEYGEYYVMYDNYHHTFKIATYGELPDPDKATEYGYMCIYSRGLYRVPQYPIYFNIYRRVCPSV